MFGVDAKAEKQQELRERLLAQLQARDGDVSAFSLKELLEAGGCCVVGTSEFNAWCEAHQVYEFLTAEYVSRLAAYLNKRVAAHRQVLPKGTAPRILELGAGNGRLAHLLRRQGLEVLATDNGSWKSLGKPQNQHGSYAVESSNFKAALQRHQPRPREARRHQSTVPHSAARRGCASHRAPRVCNTRRPRRAANTSSCRVRTSSRVTNHLCRTRRRVSV